MNKKQYVLILLVTVTAKLVGSARGSNLFVSKSAYAKQGGIII